jgi:uncharacterized protein YjiS (DUF1127 family)
MGPDHLSGAQIMTLFVDGESETAFVGRLAPSWRGLVNRVFEPVSTCYARHRQRRDLLDYLARDYRAAADIGISSSEARALSQRPFWRA